MKNKQIRDFFSIRPFLWANGFISLVFISLVLMQAGYAANSGKLYETSVKMESGKSENELIAAAFTHVLIKVSGRSEVSTSPSYKTMLEKAKGAISQFRYDYKTIQADAGAEKKANTGKEKWFWVRFNPATIDSVLKEAHLPIWGKVRPATLVWFSQEIHGQRNLQSQYDAPEIYDIISQQAEYRGISMKYPFLDLQDQASVSATDIWGDFTDAVLLASRRYQAQTTVTIRLFKEPSGLWVSQWSLLMLGNVQSWEIRDKKRARSLASGVDELADKLAQQFTRVGGERSEDGILVQVNNVSDFKAFHELDDYLRNLATVKSADLVQMEQDRVVYNISYLGDKNSFIQEIRLGDLLNSVERSRVDYDSPENENKDYQPVILDGLNAQGKSGQRQGTLSAREKALAAMDSGKDGNRPADAQAGSSEANAKATTVSAPAEKSVPELMPELEYWLAR